MYILVICWINPVLGPVLPVEERPNWKEKISSVRSVILPIFLVIMVLGAIFGGLATPSEAAAFGAVGSLICAAIHGKLNWALLKETA